MKKKCFVKLFVAALMLGLASVPCMVFGEKLRVVCINNDNNNTQEEFPHWAPAHYSNLAYAVWDVETGLLTVGFNAQADCVTISIYKDEVLIEEDCCSVGDSSEFIFNLSSYGSGDYQIVITGLGNTDLYGYFAY